MREWRELGPQDLGLTRAERGCGGGDRNKEGSAWHGLRVCGVGWALANECVRLSRQAIFLLCLLGALLGRLRAGKGGRARRTVGWGWDDSGC